MRPSIARPLIPLPGFALKALVGPQFADEAVLASQKVIPAALTESGFAFLDTDIAEALSAVV